MFIIITTVKMMMSGRIIGRRHESFKPYPTKATDPKTGSHH